VPVSHEIVELAPGESKPISFEAVPHEARTYIVRVNGLTGSFKAVKLGLVLRHSNPIHIARMWDAILYDVPTHRWLHADPIGLKLLDVPCTFYPTDTTFLLRVEEYAPKVIAYADITTFWYGPYVVTIPKLGSYTWNSKGSRIDGISCVDLPNVANRCLLTGYITSLYYLPWGIGSTALAATIRIDDASDISGYHNPGKYFIGTTVQEIYVDGVPMDDWGQPLVSGGNITGYLETRWLTNRFYWHADVTFL